MNSVMFKGTDGYNAIEVWYDSGQGNVGVKFCGREERISLIQTAKLIKILEQAYEEAE